MQKVLSQLINKAKTDPSIIAIAFFGSYARQEKPRDIDICIFLKPKKYSNYEISKKTVEIYPGK